MSSEDLFKEVQEQLQRERSRPAGFGLIASLVIAAIVGLLVYFEHYGIAAFVAVFFILMRGNI